MEQLGVGDPLWIEGKPINRFLVLVEGTRRVVAVHQRG